MLFLVSVVHAEDGPRFSDQELDDLISKQQKTFEIVRKCEITSFVPPDPEGRVSKIDVLGLVDRKCKVILHTDKGDATYLLSREIYANISNIQDLTNGECSGECEYSESTFKAPEPKDEDESCMRKCIIKDCDLGELACQRQNREKCEEECDMVKEPEAGSELEQCIRDCVEPEVICEPGGPDAGGEQNPACMDCAAKCTGIYGSGNNCLTEEEWEVKEKSCETCEHCYGEAVYGPSGDGYDCITDVRCFDASDEWGDDPGTGPDSWEPGHAPSEDNVYWWDYEATLELTDEGALLTYDDGEEEKQVELKIEEGVDAELRDDEIILNKDGKEYRVEEKSEELLEKHKSKDDEIKDLEIRIEEDKVAYELIVSEEVNLFGFIPVDKEVRKEIDAENLSLTDEKEPWWSFLAQEKEMLEKVEIEDSICTDSDGGIDYYESGYTYYEIQNPNQGVSQDMIKVVSEDDPNKDKCIDEKTLKENYCQDNEQKNILYECEEICYESECNTFDISNLKVKDITDDTATILWKTNIPTPSKVVYGGLEINLESTTKNHEVSLTELSEKTTYEFTVESCQKKFCKQIDSKFTTLDVGCMIDGIFYENGDPHPSNNCQVCNVDFNTASWSNCDFKGIMYLTDLIDLAIPDFEYAGYNVEGEEPNYKVWYFPNDVLEHKCYEEGTPTKTIVFDTDPDTTPKAQCCLLDVWFNCTGGEISEWWPFEGLPAPPSPNANSTS